MYSNIEMLAAAEAVALCLVFVMAIVNRTAIMNGVSISKNHTLAAVESALSFLDADGDGDIDGDDLAYIKANVNPIALVAAIHESKKAEGYRNDGIPYAPKIPVAQLFEEAVNQKSKGK